MFRTEHRKVLPEKRPRGRSTEEKRQAARRNALAAAVEERRRAPCSDCGDSYLPNWMQVVIEVPGELRVRSIRRYVMGCEALCPGCRQHRRHSAAKSGTPPFP